MSERLPKVAEQAFAVRCGEAGVICNKSYDDDNAGWDYIIIHFLADPYDVRPKDEQRRSDSAFVHVKSTYAALIVVQLKPLNALQMAKERKSYFYCPGRWRKQCPPDLCAAFLGCRNRTHAEAHMLGRGFRVLEVAPKAAVYNRPGSSRFYLQKILLRTNRWCLRRLRFSHLASNRSRKLAPGPPSGLDPDRNRINFFHFKS